MGRLRLGDLEVAVLEDLWAAEGADAKAVHRRVGARRGISLNTVQSTLERLHRKGLLEREKVSHAYVYRPALDREALLTRLIESVTAPVAGDGGGDALLAAFVDYAVTVDEAALDRLAELIARRRAEGSNEAG